MSLTFDKDALDNLTTEERLELIGALWDSITDSDPNPPVPDWHFEEVAHRRTVAEADPDSAIPSEQLQAKLMPNR